MDLIPLLKYAEYLFLSGHRNGHGIHGPFIFNLVSATFQNKIDPLIVSGIETVRRKMLNDNRKIKVTDYGAGSRKMKNDFRKISDIARYSAVTPKYGKLLFNLASAFGKPSIIEFGTSLGISTMYLAISFKGTEVFTMEGCPAISEIAARNFREAGISNVKLLTGSFDDSFAVLKNQKIRPGLVFIDGDHRREPTLRYFDYVKSISGNETVVVIDDIYSSAEMAEAWDEIKGSYGVTSTVDIFRMGIVFFRSGLNPFSYRVWY